MESNSVCNHTRSQLITFNVPITYTYKYANCGRRKYFTYLVYLCSFLFFLLFFVLHSERRAGMSLLRLFLVQEILIKFPR